MIFILIVKYLQIVFSYNMKSIVKLNSITLGFFLILSITTNLIFIMEISEENTDYGDNITLDKRVLESSVLSGKIHIDDRDPSYNWSIAKDAGICMGNGTFSNPYIIEDLVIDGGDSGSCISIENSDVYFRIENCTVYNSGDDYSFDDAGIRLYNTGNGTLIDNDCQFNFYGIYLYSSNNFTILGNAANNNDNSGIWLYNTGNGTLIGNDCSSNTYGIGLYYSNNITVLGNTANNNRESGIWLYHTDNGTLTGNECSSNIYGIWIDIGDYSTILGNIANNNHEAGILIQSSDHCTILGNTANNNLETGIWIQYSDYNIVSGNIMNECGLRLQGSLYSLASINIDDTNQVNGKPLYCYSNAVNLVPANFTNAGQVILANCDDSLISNLNISYTSYAISILYGYNNTITKNTISNNERGIYIYFSDGNTITANTLTNNEEAGMHLYSSNHNNISGNTANNNERSGIYLDNCDYNTITRNIANSNHQHGIYLYSNEWNKITENTVNYNTDSGIFLYSSNYNEISENTVKNNRFGIWLFCSDNNIVSGNTIMGNYYGIYLHASDILCGPCDSNRIYDNTFSGNGEDIYSTTDYIDNTSPDKPLPNEPSFNLIISIIFLFIGGSLIIGLIVSKSRVKH